jgi:hypothetical protein
LIFRAVHLGIFSFAKYLMWKDLADRTDILKNNPVVRHLLDTPSERYALGPSFVSPCELDKTLPPNKVFCPLPTDSSQLSAVAAAAQGKDFVLIGPPGTGKSQTISNMIAQCLAEGKTVLFVAEKAAALNVVYERLKKIGLGEFCLELHSNKARKLEILSQLKKAKDAESNTVVEEWKNKTTRMAALRGSLNSYPKEIHWTYPNGYSIFQAIGVLAKRPDSPKVKMAWPSASFHTQEKMNNLQEIVKKIELHCSAALRLRELPLNVIKRSEWSPKWAKDLVEAAEITPPLCDELERLATHVFAVSGAPALPLDSNGRDYLEWLAMTLPQAAGRGWGFVLRPDASRIFFHINKGLVLLNKHIVLQRRLSTAYRDEAYNVDHKTLLTTWKLSGAAWLRGLQESIDLLCDYFQLERSLSTSYGAGVFELDLPTICTQWEKSKNLWKLKRILQQRKIAKLMRNVAENPSCTMLDCEKDLPSLLTMRSLHEKLAGIQAPDKTAVALWNGHQNVPKPLCIAFRQAVLLAIAPLIDPQRGAQSLEGVLKLIFGPEHHYAVLTTGKDDIPSNTRIDIVDFLRNTIVRGDFRTEKALDLRCDSA